MFKTKAIQVVLVGAIAASLVGATVSAASAAEVPTGSSGPIHLLSADDGTPKTPGSTLQWGSSVTAGPSAAGSTGVATNPNELLVGSADADGVYTFLAPRGQEKVVSAWKAYAQIGFFPGSKDTWLPNVAPLTMVLGDQAAARAAGGQYSLGVAFTKNSGMTVADAGVYFTYITVTPGTGAYTFETPTTTAPADPPVGSADINLSATTVAAADGTLSLVVPANASAAIGNATLVNNLSTSTGVLGDITVKDSRVLTHKGWTLTSTVTDFAAGSSVISAAQLSVRPRIVSTTAAADSITTAAEAAAATTAKPFASATDAAQVGDTVLNADLKFVAPATAAAGVYTSKMTLTLTSK